MKEHNDSLWRVRITRTAVGNGPPCRRDLRALTWILFLAAVLATACGGGGPSSPADQAVQQGKAHFDRICATCHGSDARGLPRLGKSLRDNEFTQSQSDAELVAFLKVGRSAGDPLNETGVDMPPKGGDPTITEDDLKNIVAFLRTL